VDRLCRRLCSKGLLIAAGSLACGGDSGSTEPARPTPWVESAFTQPVPSWGSSVRLDLPVALSTIRLVGGGGDGIGAYGAHEGGHVEGLNHVWIPTGGPTTIKTWAAGTVTKIEDMGAHLAAGAHEYFVTIDYGDGLIGKHLEVITPMVKVGDRINAGAAVALGNSAEFMLMDLKRRDGEFSGSAQGSMVSPFDYLKDDVKAALVARYKAEVVEPYFRKGLSLGAQRPWEPYLSNKMLFHADHRGTIAGEWIVINKGWTVIDPVFFDVMTIFDVNNEFGQFKRYEMMDHDWSAPGNKNHISGKWLAGDAPGRIILQQDFGPTYYGLYAVDESSGRAKLTIEWKTVTYPASLSPAAAVYVERSPIYLAGDAQALGLIK
jgi:hypothetical protein